MSARGARATSTGAARQQGPEPVMSKSKKAPHLAAVEAAADSASAAPRQPAKARQGSPAHRRRARALRDGAADRLRADARGGQVGPPRQLAVGGRHRRGALLPGPAARSRPAAVARAGPLRALQGPRRPDPVRGAGPPRLLPARGPDGPAQARRPSPGPPGHDPHARASRSRPARSARASRCASASRSGCGWTASTRRTCSRCCPTATARRARPGRRRWPRPTSASRT